MEDFLNELSILFDRYPQYCHLGGQVADNVISSAEKRLDLKFPKSYQQFITKFGYGSFWGMSVGGIYPNATEDNPNGSIIIFNENARKNENVPVGLLFIMIEDEYNVVIDTMQMRDEEAPVYEIELGRGYKTEDMTPASPTFGEYYLNKVKEAINYLRAKGKIQ